MTDSRQVKYKTVLLKLSGEALQGSAKSGFDIAAIEAISDTIKAVFKLQVKLAVVIGGGNILRGKQLESTSIHPSTADKMGMLATMMNGLALSDVFSHQGIPTKVLSARAVETVVEPFDRNAALKYLNDGNVVIFAGGTGNPYCTTDTTAALRAAEIDADVILKATTVDGIYSADPKKDPKAKRYERLTYQEILQQNLQVMDLTSICMCRNQHIPIVVFDMLKKNAVENIILGKSEGTLVEE